MFLCPSLRRPVLLSALLNSWYTYSHYPLTVLLGHDDPALDDYLTLIDNYDDTSRPPITHYIYPYTSRGTMSALNHYFRAQPNLGYYGFIGEDAYLLTSNLPLVPLANYFAASWPHTPVNMNPRPDGSVATSQDIATHPVLGGELVRAVGHLAPEWMFHSFFDNYWTLIGANLQVLHYCPVVQYEHDHPVISGRAADEVNAIAQAHYRRDEEGFHAWRQSGLPNLIARIDT